MFSSKIHKENLEKGPNNPSWHSAEQQSAALFSQWKVPETSVSLTHFFFAHVSFYESDEFSTAVVLVVSFTAGEQKLVCKRVLEEWLQQIQSFMTKSTALNEWTFMRKIHFKICGSKEKSSPLTCSVRSRRVFSTSNRSSSSWHPDIIFFENLYFVVFRFQLKFETSISVYCFWCRWVGIWSSGIPF